jgi:hypothetical protein
MTALTKLIGFKVRAECDKQVFHYPEHYRPPEPEAVEAWDSIEGVLRSLGVKV